MAETKQTTIDYATMEAIPLKVVVFMSSAKTATNPWLGFGRLGSRVLTGVLDQLKKHNFDVLTVADPLTTKLPILETPHFYYKAGEAPKELDDLAAHIRNADCYVVVSAEYNHSIPPGLSNLMGHFGSSLYSKKPSAIVTYSMGQWGGARAAMALQPMLHELGCLPVSNMVHLGSAHEFFSEEGVPADQARWDKYCKSCLGQLSWMGFAMRTMREVKPDW